jgi:hypothetical protein
MGCIGGCVRSVANVPSCELRLTNETLRCVALRGRGMWASKQVRSLLSALGWSEAAPKSPLVWTQGRPGCPRGAQRNSAVR